MTSVDRDIGRLETRLAALVSKVSAMAGDVRQIRDGFHTLKGGWRALGVLIAISSGLGGLVGALWPLLSRS